MLVTFVAMVAGAGLGCSPDDWEASPDAGLDAAVTREDAGLLEEDAVLVQEDAVLVQEDARFSIDPWSGNVSNTALPALSADGTVLVVAVGFGGSEHICLPGGFDARFVRLSDSAELDTVRVHSMHCDDDGEWEEVLTPAQRQTVAGDIDQLNQRLAEGGFRSLTELVPDEGSAASLASGERMDWAGPGLRIVSDPARQSITMTSDSAAVPAWSWRPSQIRFSCTISLASADEVVWTDPWVLGGHADPSGLVILDVGVHYGSCLCDSDSSVWLVQPGRKPRALF